MKTLGLVWRNLIAVILGGAHWLTDVLAGYALGTAWAALLLAANQLAVGRSGAAELSSRS